jgi:hypothetical protein
MSNARFATHRRLVPAYLACAGLGLLGVLSAFSGSSGEKEQAYSLSFKSRAYTDPEKGRICLPRDCLSYIRFRSTGKPRPFIAGGWGKEGTMALLATPSDVTMLVRTSGTGVIEFTEFAAEPAGDAADFVCADWLRQKPDLILARILRIDSWEEQGDQMKAFLDIFRVPGKNQPPAPAPMFKAVADVELCAGAKSVRVERIPVRISLVLQEELKWFFVRTYWLMTVEGSGSFRGESLGLTGADAGDIRFDLVAAAMRSVPPPHNAIDVSIESAGSVTEQGVTSE